MSLLATHHISELGGQEIVRWSGTEMALSEEDGSRTNVNFGKECLSSSHVVWEHSSVPYFQFINLDIKLATGKIFHLISQIEDKTGFHGLYLLDSMPETGVSFNESCSIYKVHELVDLPVGLANVQVLIQDTPHAVIKARIRIGTDSIDLLAAEIHQSFTGDFEVFDRDESILIQLNGHRPNNPLDSDARQQPRTG